MTDIAEDLRALDALAARIAADLTGLVQAGGRLQGAVRRTLMAIGDLRHVISGHPPSWSGGTLAELSAMLPAPSPVTPEPDLVTVEPIEAPAPRGRRR